MTTKPHSNSLLLDEKRSGKLRPPTLSRRQFLGTTALGLGLGLGLSPATKSPPLNAAVITAEEGSFIHRSMNGWITDFATNPDPQAAWPSMRLDDALLEDYRQMFSLMQYLGFNEIVIWGLFTANNWPVDITSAVPADRGRQIDRLLSAAKRRGIKVLSGLGVYSWGFAEIIKANPKLSAGNPNTLCPSEPESHLWMERVIDFIFSRFPLDGVSMQSADQGRCKCTKCSQWSDVEYHAMLITRTAEVIRKKWPGKLIGMSNWGVSFGDPKDRDTIARLGKSLDYIIDHNDSARKGGPKYRAELIGSIGCPVGTTGGLVVEPPQHWARDRWFIPTCKRVHQHIQDLYTDGGRACEFFFHIPANPSSEITLHVAGRTLTAPKESLDTHLLAAIDDLYAPQNRTSRAHLAQFFLDAEKAYLWHLPKDDCGTFSLEPLVGNKPGPPIYLKERLNNSQRRSYASDVDRLITQFENLSRTLPPSPRVKSIAACLQSVKKDLSAGA